MTSMLTDAARSIDGGMWRRVTTTMAGATLWLAATGAVQAATFTVTNTADSGSGSLRQAVQDANALAGVDLVVFDIPEASCSVGGVCTIQLESTIAVDEAVVIDGTTQPRYGSAPLNVCATASEPSYMRVEVTGPTSTRLLQVDAVEPVIIRGLSFGLGWGIALKEGWGHRVQCNHLCLSGPGDVGIVGGWGVVVEGNTVGAIIGTDGDGVDDLAERNVFGSCDFGVYVNANPSNWIAGNFFGLGSDGLTGTGIPGALGIYMRQTSTDNLVGSNEDGISDDLERNVIGNLTYGVLFQPFDYEGTSNRVIGNWIGLDAAGFPAANQYGIRVEDAGLAEVFRGNRIEHNLTGIMILEDATIGVASMCNTVAGNTTGVYHGSAGDVSLLNSWWGAADGPSLDGPGSGDAIELAGTGGLRYTPWLTADDEACPYLFADGFERGTTSEWSLSVN